MDGDMTFQLDAIFQLEMNLQNVRKELIAMLEIYEQSDCLNCYKLKCDCNRDSQSEKSETETDKSEYIQNCIAPPASALPKPCFDYEEASPGPSTGPSTPYEQLQQNIEAWLDAAHHEKVAEDIWLVAAMNNLMVNNSVADSIVSEDDDHLFTEADERPNVSVENNLLLEDSEEDLVVSENDDHLFRYTEENSVVSVNVDLLEVFDDNSVVTVNVDLLEVADQNSVVSVNDDILEAPDENSVMSVNDNLLLIDRETTPQVAINYVNKGNTVEAFFQCFKMPSKAVTCVSTRLAPATQPNQPYSYF